MTLPNGLLIGEPPSSRNTARERNFRPKASRRISRWGDRLGNPLAKVTKIWYFCLSNVPFALPAHAGSPLLGQIEARYGDPIQGTNRSVRLKDPVCEDRDGSLAGFVNAQDTAKPD